MGPTSNGTLISQKGPVFPGWDPISVMGPMFAARVSQHPSGCSQVLFNCGVLTFWPFVMGLQVGLCARLSSAHCLPGRVDSGHLAVSPIVRRAFLEAARYRTWGQPFHRLWTPSEGLRAAIHGRSRASLSGVGGRLLRGNPSPAYIWPRCPGSNGRRRPPATGRCRLADGYAARSTAYRRRLKPSHER